MILQEYPQFNNFKLVMLIRDHSIKIKLEINLEEIAIFYLELNTCVFSNKSGGFCNKLQKCVMSLQLFWMMAVDFTLHSKPDKVLCSFSFYRYMVSTQGAFSWTYDPCPVGL